MWRELVESRGGLPLTALADAARRRVDAREFVAILVEDDELLPALAMLDPAQAVAFLLLAGDGADDPGSANALLGELRAADRPIYLLKTGRVGGKDPDLSLEIGKAHAPAILDALQAGEIEWEEDPDFGYRVAASLPGFEGRDRFLFIPRFLYARTDRVYDYAARVPALKRERIDRLSALAGLDPAIVDAVR